MRTIEYKDMEFEYDERCPKSWKWQKAINSGDEHRMMGAVERLLCGRDEEYADMLCGNDDPDDIDTAGDEMGGLVQAIILDINAKN